MQEYIEVTGLVIQNLPMGEYDKRVTILTKERGKIAAFARGARRPNSKLMARTNPFCFGTFKMYEGKSSYTLVDAEISNYFDEFRDDLEGAMYGMYFLEVADYYTRENNDEKEMLMLVYQSLRALLLPAIKNELILYIFEIKALVVNGEFPGIPANKSLSPDTLYTIDYVVKSGLDRLYTFVVSDEVLRELAECVVEYRKRYMGHEFHSLEILNSTISFLQ
ncbi:MAG: DNA repair protein RecO [Lachnospiraceae bacterium]|nr:DNA repair protein RecO [Lachnospiraceae bacterium]